MAKKKAKIKQAKSEPINILKKLAAYLGKAGIVPFLVILLLLAAFAIGYMGAEIKNLNKKQSTASVQGSSSQAATQSAKAPPKVTDSDHLRGSREAEVILIEYADFECPFCKKFHPTLVQIVNDYQGQVAWVYRHFPLGIHANAQKEAEAAECVTELGGNEKFWLFSDQIFERTKSNGTGFALDQLGPLATEFGINQEQFQKCLDSGKYTKRVTDDLAGGREAGVRGTPVTFVTRGDGVSKLISGAVSAIEVKQAIDAALK